MGLPRRNAGFTLPELMIVLAVFGLILVASMPAIGKFLHSWRLNGQADQVVATLRSARSAAVSKNMMAVFQFDMGASTYFYFEDDDGNGTKDAGEYKSGTYTFPNGMTFDSHTLGDTKIIFGPKGNSSQGGTITIANQHSATKTVSIFSGTGNVRVD